MPHWLSALSWLQLAWLGYGVMMVLLALPVGWVEHHARKVDGASGWILFSWTMLGFYGLLILSGISAASWIIRWLAG